MRNDQPYAYLGYSSRLASDSVPFYVDSEVRYFSGHPNSGPRLRAVRVADGWLIGWENAPPGLRWYSQDGSRSYPILNARVAGLKTSGDRVIALLYERSNEGKEIDIRADVLSRGDDGKWHAQRIVTLDGSPDAAEAASDGSVFVVTPNAVYRLGSAGPAEELHRFKADFGMAASDVVRIKGVIYVGFVHYVLALTRSPSGYDEHWYAPADCPLYGQTAPGQCYCIGADGAPGFRAYPFFNAFGVGLISLDRSGGLVFVDASRNQVGRLAPDGQPIEIDSRGSPPPRPYGASAADGPVGLAVDSKDDIWFAPDPYDLWRIGRDDAYLRVAPLGEPIAGQTLARLAPRIVGVAAGADGDIWYSDANRHQVVMIADGHASACLIDDAGTALLSPGQDGTTDLLDTKNLRMAPLTRDCRFHWTHIDLPRSEFFSPVTSTDGSIWVIMPELHELATISRAGHATRRAVPPPDSYIALAATRTNDVWALSNGAMTRFNADGTISTFALPNQGCSATGLAADQNGGAWYGDQCGHVVHIAADGTMTQRELPGYSSNLSDNRTEMLLGSQPGPRLPDY